MKEKENFVKVCPVCASEDWGFEKSNKYLEGTGLRNYVCNNCHNLFSFPIELDKGSAKKIFDPKKVFPNATPKEKFAPIGVFQARIIFKIEGAANIFLGLVLMLNGEFLSGLAVMFFGFALVIFSLMADVKNE